MTASEDPTNSLFFNFVVADSSCPGGDCFPHVLYDFRPHVDPSSYAFEAAVTAAHFTPSDASNRRVVYSALLQDLVPGKYYSIVVFYSKTG